MSDLVTVVDFETFAIGPRPGEYPPRPVGVAIRWPSGNSEYLAFAHPNGTNNCTEEEVQRALRVAFKGPVLFHNAKFDLEVAWKWLGIPWPKNWHDTLLLAFLQAPDEPTYALKPLTEKFLNLPPVQQDAVHDWIMRNVKGARKSNAGAYIAQAPVDLVRTYAISDVERTYALFRYFYPNVVGNGMMPAYDRERRLVPHLCYAEQRGIRVDRKLLIQWYNELAQTLAQADHNLRARLNDQNLNLDSDDLLALALEREGLVSHWETPEGVPFDAVLCADAQTVNPFSVGPPPTAKPLTRSMSKGALSRCCTDKELVALLAYRNTAATMFRSFVVPWLDASKADGRLHTEWHQTRGQEKNGTRTGRISSARPNLANVPNPVETPPPFGFITLPNLRQAFLPEEGHVWISADYSQQELRVTAHFENQQMQLAYQKQPKLDLHAFAQQLIKERVGKIVPRKHVKNVAFASIYGAGIPTLARMLGVSEEEAEEIREAYFVALPGLRQLIIDVRIATRRDGFVRSLGERMLTLEPPQKVYNKQGVYTGTRSFEYKQTNKLIQGSAADMTKEAIARFCESGGSSYFMSQVYDEINISVPEAYVVEWAQHLRNIMVTAMPLDVPILVDVEVGENWGQLRPLVLPSTKENNEPV